MKLIVYLGLFVSALISSLAGTTNDFLPATFPDWKLETIAIAPKVETPTVICTAPDGRIFVGQDPMDMLQPSEKPSDSIICIHPDGKITMFATNLYAVFGLQYIDGKLYVHHSPKFSVFDDVNGVGTNRVDLIETDNPHPWGPTFNDHIPSNFRLGMDGFLYVSTGDKGVFGAKGKDGRQIELHGGGIFRMRPDGTELEVYSTGTRNHLDVAIDAEDELFTYDNTDDGQGWWSRVTHMVDGGFYGYPYDYKPQRPYTLWMMGDYGGGSATGAIAYNEDGLPDEYKGNLFLCDWGRQQVLRLRIQRSGGTYNILSRVQVDGHDFLTQTNKNGGTLDFRPVGITVSPDGKSFYVADWYCAGWKGRGANTTLTVPSGRILKVTYTGNVKQTPKPSWYVPASLGKPFKAKTKELIAALSHPSQNVRFVAQRRLVDRKFDGYSRLVSLIKDKKAPAYARWSAIWTLDRIDNGKKGRATIIAALNDKDTTVRLQAARQLGTARAKDAVPALIPLLQDTNAAVVFRAATALGRIGDPKTVTPLLAALEQKDLFARFSVFTALSRIGQSSPAAWKSIVAAFQSEKPAVREGVSFALRQVYDTNLVTELSRLALDEAAPMDVRTNAFDILSKAHRKEAAWTGEWWNTQPVTGTAPAHTLDWQGSAQVAETMRIAMKTGSPAIRQIALKWVQTSQDKACAAALREMYKGEQDQTLKLQILQALGELKDAESSRLVADILKTKQTTGPLLNTAIEAAGKINTPEVNEALTEVAGRDLPIDALSKLVQSFGNTRLQVATPVLGRHLSHSNNIVRQNAETALIQIGGDAAAKEFLAMMTNSTVDYRRSAARALGTLKSRIAIPTLIEASTNPSTRDDATTALAQMPDASALDAFLNGLNSKNANLRGQCQQAIENIREQALPVIEAKLATNGIPSELVGSLQKIYGSNTNALKGPLFKVKATQLQAKDYEGFALKNPGDVARGKAIFHDMGGVACIRCHRMNGDGGEIGPDLSDVAKKYGKPMLIDAILNPSKQILDGYQVTTFDLKDGEQISGAIKSESSDDVTVMDSAGEKHVIAKTNIMKRKTSQVSLMPEGLHTGLSLLEFSDLIAYVSHTTNATSATTGTNVIKLTPIKITSTTPTVQVGVTTPSATRGDASTTNIAPRVKRLHVDAPPPPPAPPLVPTKKNRLTNSLEAPTPPVPPQPPANK